MEINGNEERMKEEKELVKAYVGTLQSLDSPFSDRIELLPDGLSEKAAGYYGYEKALSDPALEHKRPPEEVRKLRDECRAAFNGFNEGLTGLLARHGYTFGEPDSLKKNLHRRLEDLLEDYHALEGDGAEPLLVDYTYRTPASQVVPNLARYNQATVQLHGVALPLNEDEPAYMMDGGMQALKDLIDTQQPGSPMQITQIGNVYGAVYAVRVTEELTRWVSVDARSAPEAAGTAAKMVEDEEIVLDADDYAGVSIGSMKMDGAAGKFQYGPHIEAGPDGNYSVRITEYLETVVRQEGTSRDDAEERVRCAYEDEDIVLGADDYDCREIAPASRIADSRLSRPEPVRTVDGARFRRLMQEARPEGMYVRFHDESVAHLLQVAAGRDNELYGIIGSPDGGMDWGLSDGRTLRTEADLRTSDYAAVRPDADHYDSPGRGAGTDLDTYVCTHFNYRYPGFDRGYVTVDATDNILDRVRVEGVPFREAIRMLADQLIADESQFREAAAVYRRQHGLEASQSLADARKKKMPGIERVSDITVIRAGGSRASIRCRIDGIQQMAVPVSSKDRILLSNELTTKEELAMKYFKDELDAPAERQGRGMGR